MSAGRWPSPLDAATVAAAGLRLAQPMLHDGWAYWLEGRPSEGGRVTLLRQRDQPLGAEREELTPAPLSVRTRVHEYGGGAYLACDAGVFIVAEGFGDARDGQVWWRDPTATAFTPLTTSPDLRFADLEHDPLRARLLCVVEDHRRDRHRPRNLIAAIALGPGPAPGMVEELVTGHDFYAHARIAPDGVTLAFLAWDLPAMPWDGAVLYTTTLDAVTGGAAASVARSGPAAFQPTFAPTGALWTSADASGRFTLGPVGGPAHRDGPRECALPLWNLNMRCFGFADARTVVAASVADGLWALRVLDPARDSWRDLACDLTQIDHVHAAAGEALVLGGGARQPLCVQRFDLARNTRITLVRSSALELDPQAESVPAPLAFPGDDGGTVHGLWWPPASATHALAPGELPPLLLRCHGGPTAMAQSAQDARTLYWTTRGFAVLDLNYRGSWGFGRDYRRALDGAWGDRDARDALAAARFAIASGRADPLRIAISGASAGGLTVLNALTLPDAPFRSAAVHYGLADLATAMNDTHKFESGYGTRLLGAWPAAQAIYTARSPLMRIAAPGCPRFPPTILFQGADDRVVPPDQSARMVAALRERGITAELHLYPGEGHGFRRATTLTTVLERELGFHLAAFDRAAAAR